MASKFLDAIKFSSQRTEEGSLVSDVESNGVGEESDSTSSGRWPLLRESFSFGSGATEDPPEESFEICPALTYQQRIIGMFCCLAMGYLIGFGSFLRFKVGGDTRGLFWEAYTVLCLKRPAIQYTVCEQIKGSGGGGASCGVATYRCLRVFEEIFENVKCMLLLTIFFKMFSIN